LVSREVPGMHGQGTQVAVVSTHVPLQHSEPLGQAPPMQVQPPLRQLVPLGQLLPHDPQLPLLPSEASHPSPTFPLQSSKPSMHALIAQLPVPQVPVALAGLQLPAQVSQ
jgi:hypothetical protein